MSKYLINRIDTFRVDTEEEAKTFIEQLKQGTNEVLKYSIEYKEQKSKGEVVQSWYRLVVKIQYNEEKEPLISFLLGNEDE